MHMESISMTRSRSSKPRHYTVLVNTTGMSHLKYIIKTLDDGQ